VDFFDIGPGEILLIIIVALIVWGPERLAEMGKTIGKTVDQMREELKPAAQTRVAESLVLGKIAEQEKIEVTPAEIDTEIEDMVKNSQGDKEALKKALNTEPNRESLENTLVTRKVLKFLTEIAKAPKEKTEPGAEISKS
jgi:trigger factor